MLTSDHHTQDAYTASLGRALTLEQFSFPDHRQGLGKMDWQDHGTKSMFHKQELFPKEATVKEVQVDGFCDASEGAYAGAIYIRGIDLRGRVHVSLVVAKTKVAPIKRLTIPRLELCGALIMTRLLKDASTILNVPMENTYAWTDSRIVLDWLRGDPRRFKVFVGYRVSEILELHDAAKFMAARIE